jgi:paraquat-inducible protein A
MSLEPDRAIGCPECDQLVDAPLLEVGQRARCRRCGYLLTTCLDDPFGRALAYAVAALVMIAVAVSFPFLSISASGVTNGMTLTEAVSLLAEYGANGIAVLVFLFVILVPVIMLVWITVLSSALRKGFFHWWMTAPTRWLFHLNGWAMVEVFAIGVIVSLVKLAAMANVELGIAFWAYMVFALLFLRAFASLDRYTVWSRIEMLRASRRSGESATASAPEVPA